MDLLRMLLIYMTMIFVSSVQTAPEPVITPEPTVIAQAVITPTPAPTAKPTPVPTPAITPNPEYKQINVGDKGDEVLALQKKLAEYGYYEGELDGKYGNQTRRAVERFQYANGLSSDGVAGRYTLTVLYESSEVRLAPTPTPDPDALTTALPQPETTPIPIDKSNTEIMESLAPTDTPMPERTIAPTDTPVPEESLAPTDTPVPERTIAPTDTPAPERTPASGFMPMTGYSICMSGSDEILYEKGKSEPLAPYIKDVNVYVPFLRIVEMSGSPVIPNETIELSEYAFTLGEDIYRISFTENRNGELSGMEAYIRNEPQTLPIRDVRVAQGEIYLPMESVESLTGIRFDMDDELKRIIVNIPGFDEKDD